MKNLRISLIAISCCFISVFCTNAVGQTTSLTYKEKGKSTFIANISFSNNNGIGKVPLPSEYFSYSDIFFNLTLKSESEKDFFRENDVNEIFSKITIIQGDKNLISQSGLPKILLNDKGKIDHVIIAFPKNKLVPYDSFYFGVGDFFSEKIKLEEKYFESFALQKKLYDQGLALIEQKDYLGAYSNFISIIDNGNKNIEIQNISFYNQVRNEKILLVLNSFINSEQSKFNDLDEIFNEKKTYSALNACDSLMKSISEKIDIFNSYFLLKGEQIKKAETQIKTFLNSVTEKNKENFVTFENEKMLFFKQGDYTEYKFDLFIKLISKILISKESLSQVDKLFPLDINRLKKFPDDKKELIGDWNKEFDIYVKLINKNIEQNGLVFNDDVMNNLEKLLAYQKQPYYEIISAFNSLNKNPEIFKADLEDAQVKCSDETILDYIENWLLSYRLTVENLKPSLINQLNEGLDLVQKGQFNQADSVFNLLMRLENENAIVWYYAGKIKYYQGENYSAERFFLKAMELYPSYIAPQKFILDIYKDNKNYKQYLETSIHASENINIWFFHYKIAFAYYQLKMYKKAIEEINQECIKRNSWDKNQYFLLGDSYLAINDFDNAYLAYSKIIEIDPYSLNSKLYEEKMQTVYAQNGGVKPNPKKNIAIEKEIIDNIAENKDIPNDSTFENRNINVIEKKEDDSSLIKQKEAAKEVMNEPQIQLSETKIEDQEILMYADFMPEFPGGESAMLQFISDNIVYPETAKEKGISGIVYISFVIEPDGSIDNIKILRGIGEGCDEEAVRIVQSMPKWTSGKKGGKPVRIQYRAPINFSLE